MALDPVLYRTPLLDPKTGAMSREWIRFFDQRASDGIWREWTPVLSSWAGMTVSGVVFHDAQYTKIGDTVFIKLYADMTLGGTASNQIFVPLPFPVAGTPFYTATGFSAMVHPPGGAWSTAWGYFEPAGSLAKTLLPGEVNFPLGATSILIEGFYRST